MNVYQITVGGSIRYIRAASAAHARVRAWKVWARPIHSVSSIGQYAPAIGAAGYDSAANSAESHAVTSRDLRTMQRGGYRNSFYKLSERKATDVRNRAADMLRTLGLA